ncbi:maleylpyruvate isomerase N-terminal domain-containing protein [Streptomyces sp. NPDC018045]|uniref:maleylpyruvate isomerase N-terminal domain-containing protein n=1 Tax=Streptomyces sp. NPDC018045 TaxID=3365037 RepID=UPI0037B8DE58
MTGTLDHDRYCAEVLAQTDLLRQTVRGADLKATVPTCPEWTLEDLLRHVGGAYRWVDTVVRTRATEMVPHEATPNHKGPTGSDPAALDAWLADGARRVVEALREVGPDARIWTWAPDQPSGFWARRMVHETAVHRADAAATTGAAFSLDPEVAADTVEEWTQLICLVPRLMPDHPANRLLGTGRTLRLHATDAPPGAPADWLLDFTGDAFTYRHSSEEATVTLQAPLADLLRVYYRRLPTDTPGVRITGDRAFLEEWLEAARF